MRLERVLQAAALAGAGVLAIILLAMAVDALRGWMATLILVGAILLALVARSLVRRRVPGGTVIEVDLDGGVVETSGSDPLSRAMTMRSVTVRDVVDALARGADDPRVAGLVVRLGNGGIDVGHAQELRDAVERFRASGKHTVAFAEAFGESRAATVDFYLAAAFDEIYLQPQGMVSIQGMLARSPFLRGVLDRLGLVPDFDHRKEYKAAKYLLTETRFTEPHREALEAVSADRFSQVMAGIAEDRDLPRETVERLIDTAPLTAGEALEAGLVDHVGYRDAAYEAAGTRFMFHDRYLRRAGRPHRKGERVALIYGTGSITRGSPRFDPLTGGTSFGADEVARAFRQAIDSDKVKAIVFRVDSPGGSAVASEIVSHEVQRARRAGKPVVVSMANVAGSGGYWVAARADRIVAHPGTVTGSIGVVWGKLATREAWRRLGVTFDEIPFGENATFASSRDVYSDSERPRVTALIDDVYDSFVSHVASGREMSPETVEEAAKGRIWTGAQAHDLGLVDELGGLEKALELAMGLADITDRVRVDVFPPKRALPTPERRDSSEPIGVAAAVLVDLLSGVRDISGAQARMPWARLD